MVYRFIDEPDHICFKAVDPEIGNVGNVENKTCHSVQVTLVANQEPIVPNKLNIVLSRAVDPNQVALVLNGKLVGRIDNIGDTDVVVIKES